MNQPLKIADYNTLPLLAATTPEAGAEQPVSWRLRDGTQKTPRQRRFVDGGTLGPIPLWSPKQQSEQILPEDSLDGELPTLRVFVYRDAHCELQATTEVPLAVAGDVACLKVVGLSAAGAFLDWGIEQQILLPTSQQQKPLSMGQKAVVYLELDRDTERVIASSKLSRHLSETPEDLNSGDKVSLMITDATTMGFKTLINGHSLGLLYRNEVFQPLHVGQTLSGYIKEIRHDGKVDLCLEKPGVRGQKKAIGDELCNNILEHLNRNNGTSSMTDSSPPEQIYQRFKVSKKAFKRAIGTLYKQRKIIIESDRIVLVTDATPDATTPAQPNPWKQQSANPTKPNNRPKRRTDR